MFGHSYKHTLETQKRAQLENPETRNELLGIVTDDISTLSPLISCYHSSSVCLGLPIMHHWVYKVSYCTCEPPDGAPGLNWHQTGQRESPPLRRQTQHKLMYMNTVISTGPSNIFRNLVLTLYFLIKLCGMNTISSSTIRPTATAPSSQSRHICDFQNRF